MAIDDHGAQPIRNPISNGVLICAFGIVMLAIGFLLGAMAVMYTLDDGGNVPAYQSGGDAS